MTSNSFEETGGEEIPSSQWIDSSARGFLWTVACAGRLGGGKSAVD